MDHISDSIVGFILLASNSGLIHLNGKSGPKDVLKLAALGSVDAILPKLNKAILAIPAESTRMFS